MTCLIVTVGLFCILKSLFSPLCFRLHRNSEIGLGITRARCPTLLLRLGGTPRAPERRPACKGSIKTAHWGCLWAWLCVLSFWLFWSKSIIKAQLNEAFVKTEFLIKICNEQKSNHISPPRAGIDTGLTAPASAILFNEAYCVSHWVGSSVIWPNTY